MFYLAYPFRSSGKLFLANSNNDLIIVDSSSGEFEKISAETVPKSYIRHVCYHHESGIFAMASNEKDIQLWDLKNMTLLSSIKSFKRAMCMEFSKNGKFLFLGDRAGDLYRYEIGTDLKLIEPPVLLVGHVSILTDFLLVNDESLLITCDRDEKIRIQKYPATYNIEHFCLEHKEYVSRLVLIPNSDYFLSAGGDDAIFLWNFKTGALIDQLPISLHVSLEGLKTDVAHIEYHQESNTLLILLQKYKGLLLFEMQECEKIKFKKSIVLNKEPLKAAFDDVGNIWVANFGGPIDVAVLESNYSLMPQSSLQLNSISQLQIENVMNDDDIYEISKMRKWSQWNPEESKKRKLLEKQEMDKKPKGEE